MTRPTMTRNGVLSFAINALKAGHSFFNYDPLKFLLFVINGLGFQL